MKKYFYMAFALMVGALAFTACNDKDKNNPTDESNNGNNGNNNSEVVLPSATIWVSDSILDENEKPIQEAIMVEIINDKQVLFHGQDTATYVIFKEHFFTITFKDEVKIDGEVMFGEGNWVCVDVTGEKLDHIGIWSGAQFARLFMYKLPQPEGKPIDVNEANLLGKWRTTYEINTSYDNEGKNGIETKFYHGWQIWDIQANGVAKAISAPYSYDGWWALDGDKLALYTGKKPAELKADNFRQVELYSNFMHIIHFTYRQDGTLYSSNQQFLYRVN